MQPPPADMLALHKPAICVNLTRIYNLDFTRSKYKRYDSSKPKEKSGEPTLNMSKSSDKNQSLTVITTHINADFDGLASMLAAQKLYPEAVVIFPGSQEKNLRNFFINSMAYLFNMVEIKRYRFFQRCALGSG